MVIDKEFESLLPPLPEEDYKGLEESIKSEGCRDPLVVWGKEEILVDGHNRYKICTENNIHYEITAHQFKDRNEVIMWIISNQLRRRNVSAFERSALALKLKPKLSQEAKERQGTRTDIKPNIVQKSAQCKTSDKLAEIAGVSRDTIQKTETIITQGTPEDIKEVRAGKASISGKAKEIKERDKKDPEDTPKKEGRDLKVVYEGIERSYTNYSHTVKNFISDYKTELAGNSGKLKKLLQEEIQELQKIVQDMED